MMLGNKTMHFVLAGFLLEKMSSEICCISSDLSDVSSQSNHSDQVSFLEVSVSHVSHKSVFDQKQSINQVTSQKIIFLCSIIKSRSVTDCLTDLGLEQLIDLLFQSIFN